MNSYENEFDDDYDDGMDQYDINPSTARARGGGTNRPFHSGKGTRAREAVAVKQGGGAGQKDASKESSKKSSKKSSK
jgi:hypothetical protein